MTRIKAVLQILEELDLAEQLHPSWPKDRVYQAAIVAEEAGEALKEALNLRPEDYHSTTASIDKLRQELRQTGAMAIRALIGTYEVEEEEEIPF